MSNRCDRQYNHLQNTNRPAYENHADATCKMHVSIYSTNIRSPLPTSPYRGMGEDFTMANYVSEYKERMKEGNIISKAPICNPIISRNGKRQDMPCINSKAPMLSGSTGQCSVPFADEGSRGLHNSNFNKVSGQTVYPEPPTYQPTQLNSDINNYKPHIQQHRDMSTSGYHGNNNSNSAPLPRHIELLEQFLYLKMKEGDPLYKRYLSLSQGSYPPQPSSQQHMGRDAPSLKTYEPFNARAPSCDQPLSQHSQHQFNNTVRGKTEESIDERNGGSFRYYPADINIDNYVHLPISSSDHGNTGDCFSSSLHPSSDIIADMFPVSLVTTMIDIAEPKKPQYSRDSSSCSSLEQTHSRPFGGDTPPRDEGEDKSNSGADNEDSLSDNDQKTKHVLKLEAASAILAILTGGDGVDHSRDTDAVACSEVPAVTDTSDSRAPADNEEHHFKFLLNQLICHLDVDNKDPKPLDSTFPAEYIPQQQSLPNGISDTKLEESSQIPITLSSDIGNVEPPEEREALPQPSAKDTNIKEVFSTETAEDIFPVEMTEDQQVNSTFLPPPHPRAPPPPKAAPPPRAISPVEAAPPPKAAPPPRAPPPPKAVSPVEAAPPIDKPVKTNYWAKAAEKALTSENPKWKSYTNPKNGKVYYVNSDEKRTVWNLAKELHRQYQEKKKAKADKDTVV